jgi:flagellar hook-associated protein 1
MSISGAASNALSGLMANSKSINLASQNIANALTPGYSRREIEMQEKTLAGIGQGVKTGDTQRVVNNGLLAELRNADANVTYDNTKLAFLNSLTSLFGSVEDADSLSGRIGALETSLVQAASRPDSEQRLKAVLESAQSITAFLNSASKSIQNHRLTADTEISNAVAQLTDRISKVEDLNKKISTLNSMNLDASALLDERQRQVDEISKLVPVREIPRENGKIALFTTKGLQLLDGRQSDISFQKVGAITDEMTVTSGDLFELTVDGRTHSFGANTALFGDGQLSALFAIRDTISVEAQAKLDAISREFIERFSDPGVDPTLAIGVAGLFSDAGQAFNILTETGLAARISVNPNVVPTQGGALWRLKAGIGAASPVAASDGSRFLSYINAMTKTVMPSSGSIGSSAGNMIDFSLTVIADFGYQRNLVEDEASFRVARQETLRERFLGDAVDTEQELQTLQVLQQAYTANAKVISSIDQLLQVILSI